MPRQSNSFQPVRFPGTLVTHLEIVTTVFVALILAMAALLKAIDPTHTILGIRASLGFYPPYWAIGLLLFGEFMLAGWLISGHKRRGALIATTCTFGIFTLYHLFNILSGNITSCGCLGSLWLFTSESQPHVYVEAALAFAPFAVLTNITILGSRSSDRVLTKIQLNELGAKS